MKHIFEKLKQYYSTIKQHINLLVEKLKMTEHLFMLSVAALVGILAGLGAVVIRQLINIISDVSFSGEGNVFENIVAAPWYLKLIIPTIGGLIVGPIIYFFSPEAKGHGVAEVMHSMIIKGGVIRPRVAFFKTIASAITIGTGGSVGREGPIVQIGASLGSSVGQIFEVSTMRMKTLSACGAGAGIAAAFNAPVAGALFAFEIILLDFGISQFTPVVISSVIATVVSHSFEGNFAAFVVPVYHLENPWEIFFYIILGCCCAFASYLFIKVLYSFEEFWDNITMLPDYIKPAIGGLIVGAVGILFPQLFGMGYYPMTEALNGQMVWFIAIALIFLKIFATSTTLASGGAGGVFAPSLFIGAMLGVVFGTGVQFVFPDITAQPGAYALVAMGGLIAGTMKAPLTAIIIVFELTKSEAIILPLMITCSISTILTSKFIRESIYTLKLINKNIKLKERAEMNILKTLFVNDIFTKKYTAIPENLNFNEIISRIISGKNSYLFVHTQDNEYLGVITIDYIKDFLFEKDSLQNILIARDVADKSVPFVKVSENLKSALDKMRRSGYDGLPVVSTENESKQIGVIWRRELDEAYHKEIERIDLTSDLASKIVYDRGDNQDFTFLEGYLISEIPVPKSFVGKSLRQAEIRTMYSIDVLTVKSHTKKGKNIFAIPGANYIFKKDDVIVIAGEKEKINIFKMLD